MKKTNGIKYVFNQIIFLEYQAQVNLLSMCSQPNHVNEPQPAFQVLLGQEGEEALYRVTLHAAPEFWVENSQLHLF